jgi:hypothetical protein
MLQEVTAFYQAGAFGDPLLTATQILFWGRRTSCTTPAPQYQEVPREAEQEEAADMAAAAKNSM